MNLPYILVTAITFILILLVLVLVHELGHFLTARLFKVRVEEFGLGFPPRVYPSRQVAARRRAAGKTVYSLNALPLGGFVRLAGENGVASRDPDPADSTNAGGNRVTADDRDSAGTRAEMPGGREYGRASLSGGGVAADDPGAFANKPAWQRAIILVAGAFNNMVLAMLLIFVSFALIGTPHTSVAVIGIAAGSPADRSGVKAGDVLVRVAGKAPQDTAEVRDIVAALHGQPVALQVQRGSQTRTVTLVPRSAAGLPCDQGPIGIMTNPVNEHNVPVDLGHAANAALNVPGEEIGGWLTLIGSGFSGSQNAGVSPQIQTCDARSAYYTYSGHTVTAAVLQQMRVPGGVREDPCLTAEVSDSGISGPIGILKMVGCEANSVSTQGIMPLLLLVVQLSAGLAVVNLLPIPALDGGRLLFVLISVVVRRRVRPEVEGMAHAMGMLALLTLMLFVSYHDLTGRWF